MTSETGYIELSSFPGCPRTAQSKIVMKVKTRLKRKKRIPARKSTSDLRHIGSSIIGQTEVRIDPAW